MEAWIRDVLAAWVEGVRRRPGWVLLAAALLSAACGALAALRLGVNSDTETLFDESLEFRRLETEIDGAFPMLENQVLLVLDASSDARAQDAAEALAGRFAQEPEFYQHVHAPGSGPFFRRHGLLYMEVEALEELVDRLAGAQPFLAELARDPGLRGFLKLVSQAVERADAAAGRGIDLEAALAQVEEAVRSARRLQVRPLVFDELMVGGVRPGGGGRRYVLVQPRVDFGELLVLLRGLERMHAIVAEEGLGPGSGVRVRITGNLPLNTEEMEVVSRQAGVAGVVSFVLVTAILFAALGSVRLVLATSLTLAAGLAWTAGFATLAVGRLNLISVGFAVLFIGLGVDFGIHFCLRYRELRRQGEGHAEALAETARSVGASLWLCAITTAIGFFAFVPTGYRGVAELGVIAGAGIFLSLLASLTLIPAILSFRLDESESAGARATPAAAVAAAPPLPSRHPRSITAFSLALAVVAALLAPRLGFDPNPLRIRDPGSESVRTFGELVAEGDVNPWSAEVLVDDLDQAEALAARLAALPGVERSVTLRSYIPPEQEAKREILADARLFLNLPAGPLAPAVAAPAQELRALLGLRDALESFAAGAAPSGLRAYAERIVDEIRAFEAVSREPAAAEARLAALSAALVDPVLAGIRELGQSLEPATISEASLPAELRERLLAPDGRARVQVFPAANLNDNRALERFVADVRAVAPRASGDSVYMLESGRTIVRALLQAFGTATLFILGVLLLLWRNLRDTALVLAPILLASLLIAAISVLAAMPLNFANVIVLPLLLGIGVDSGIHMVHRFRAADHHEILTTSTPRAVAWSALTTIASFGTLAFSTHRGMASLGQLLVLGVLLTLFCNLVVLPALIALTRSGRRDAAS